jgi:hypothetical protein
MTSKERTPQAGEVLSAEWVRERHALEDATQSRLNELEAEVAELKQML